MHNQQRSSIGNDVARSTVRNLADSDYREIKQRLVSRTSVAAHRLAGRLSAVQAGLEVDERVLRQTLAQLRRQAQRGLAPSTEHFHHHVAQPLASRFEQALFEVIDEEVEHYTDAVQRFRQSVGADRPGHGPRAQLAVASHDLADAKATVAAVRLDPEPLQNLGDLHDQMVRRAATRQALINDGVALGRLGPNDDSLAEATRKRERRLLDRCPHAHGEILLVAFLGVHRSSRRYLHHQLGRLPGLDELVLPR